jgi:hypothetical protein
LAPKAAPARTNTTILLAFSPALGDRYKPYRAPYSHKTRAAGASKRWSFGFNSTMEPHSSTGYEVLFRAYLPGGYATIARWNGPLGSFTYLNQQPNGNYHGIQTGDVVKATIDENGVIIGYVNGVEVIRATDKTYPSGNPGIGFWLLAERREGRRSNADYGFSSFTATDGLPSPERK